MTVTKDMNLEIEFLEWLIEKKLPVSDITAWMNCI